MNAEMFIKLWGQELRRVREAAGLSQVEMAERMQTTQKQIYRIESGSNMTLGTVCKWYTACGLEPIVPDKPRN